MMTIPAPKIRVGISGWTFPAWRGVFYPENLKQKDELSYASRALGAIEINGTFYSLQKPHTFQKWYAETPDDFVFTVKAPKFITHVRRLKEFETPLANFLGCGLLCLEKKLGAILWQFAPQMPFMPERFEPFFAALPHTTKDAAKIAKKHSDWLKGSAVTSTKYTGRMRHAIEVRHHSFKCQEFVDLARRYQVAVVVGDTAGRWPYMEDVTADFVYVRLHGDETKYPKGYTKEALNHWEKRLNIWAAGNEPNDAHVFTRDTEHEKGRLVFAFFDNDEKTTAPINALTMIKKLKTSGTVR